LDVVGSARVSGIICTVSGTMTMLSTFTNVFQYSSTAVYIVTFCEYNKFTTYGTFIVNTMEETFNSLGSNNITGRFSGGYLQIKSDNAVSYVFNWSALRLV